MVVGVVLETIKSQEFGLGLLRLAEPLDSYSVNGVIAAAAPIVLAVTGAAVSLTIPER
jgi:hypothetical protein